MKRICPVCQKEYYLDKFTERIIKDFPDRKEFWVESSCPESSNHFLIVRKREVASLPRETKQKVLDLVHEGKTIGEVRKELNLELMVVCEIINQNIKEIHYLSRELVEEKP